SGMRPARIVADHAADRASILGSGVGGKEKTVLCNSGVEMRLHDAGLTQRDPPLDVDMQNRVHVLGEVEYECGVAGLAGERGAAAAGQHGNLILVGEFDRDYDVALVTRDNDADGYAAIVG